MATKKVIKRTTTTKKTNINNSVKKKTTTKSKTTTKKSAIKKATKISKEKEEGFYATVGRLALKNITDLVSEALPSKDFNDAKSGIFIETKYENDIPMLYMTANSLNVFISYGIELQDDISEGFVVPKGKDFRNIISGLQNFNSPIEMKFDDLTETFGISCGDDYDGTIQHYDVNGFIFPPTLEDIKSNETISIPVKFIQEALNKIAFACSNDMTIPELTGVLIEQDKNNINIVGGDGNRLSYLTIKSKVKNPKKVIIGVKYLSLFNNILKTLEIKPSETITLYLSDDKLYFVVGNAIIGIQVFAGEYPIDGGYEQFVIDEDECEIALKLNINDFISKMDLAVLHNNSRMDPIKMIISEDECKLCNSEMSENKFNIEFDKVDLRLDSESDEIEIEFTPAYLYDVLSCLDGDEFVLSLETEQGPANVRPITNKSGEYLHIFSLN